MSQQWLPGLDEWRNSTSEERERTPRRPRSRSAGKPPTVDKIVAKATPKVRKLFDSLRFQLTAEKGIAETVGYDDSSGSFLPAYHLGAREVLRLHLDPVLAATITLEPGDALLARLLSSPSLPERLKTKAIQCARKSGRRIFLAFLARTAQESHDLMAVVRERLAFDRE